MTVLSSLSIPNSLSDLPVNLMSDPLICCTMALPKLLYTDHTNNSNQYYQTQGNFRVYGGMLSVATSCRE